MCHPVDSAVPPLIASPAAVVVVSPSKKKSLSVRFLPAKLLRQIPVVVPLRRLEVVGAVQVVGLDKMLGFSIPFSTNSFICNSPVVLRRMMSWARRGGWEAGSRSLSERRTDRRGGRINSSQKNTGISLRRPNPAPRAPPPSPSPRGGAGSCGRRRKRRR